MRNNRPLLLDSLLFSAFLVLFPLFSTAQCVPVSVEPNQEQILITGVWAEGGSPDGYVGYIRLKSDSSAMYDLAATSMLDEETTATIPSESIQISAGELNLMAGQSQEVMISVRDVRSAGTYEGLLQITQQGAAGNCYREIPLILDLKVPGQITVLETDVSLVIKTVQQSWMKTLLPQSIRQKGIFVRVENAGPASVSFDDFSLSLKGESTQHPLTKEDVEWNNKAEIIPPGGIATMEFLFTKEAQKELMADEYTGSIRLHATNFPETLSVGIQMYARTGVMGALIALLIGILVGRMIKSVNNNGAQIDVMNKFVPIRDRIRTIEEASSKQALLEEADKVEAQINQVTGEEDKAIVESSMELLNWKISQISKLEDTYEKLVVIIKQRKISQNDQKPIIASINFTKNAILSGDHVATKEGYANIHQLSSSLIQSSRSLQSNKSPEADMALESHIQDLDSLLQQEDPAGDSVGSSQQGALQKFWEWFFRLFSLLGGVKVSARVRYGFFRPLVAIITFIVILLLGFQEIYLNGGDTFGAEGIYDHLKLFGWGLVSDVFSRTLTDEKTIGSLNRSSSGS